MSHPMKTGTSFIRLRGGNTFGVYNSGRCCPLEMYREGSKCIKTAAEQGFYVIVCKVKLEEQGQREAGISQ